MLDLVQQSPHWFLLVVLVFGLRKLSEQLSLVESSRKWGAARCSKSYKHRFTTVQCLQTAKHCSLVCPDMQIKRKPFNPWYEIKLSKTVTMTAKRKAEAHYPRTSQRNGASGCRAAVHPSAVLQSCFLEIHTCNNCPKSHCFPLRSSLHPCLFSLILLNTYLL